MDKYTYQRIKFSSFFASLNLCIAVGVGLFFSNWVVFFGNFMLAIGYLIALIKHVHDAFPNEVEECAATIKAWFVRKYMTWLVIIPTVTYFMYKILFVLLKS